MLFECKVNEWINVILPVIKETFIKILGMPQTGIRFVTNKSDSD